MEVIDLMRDNLRFNRTLTERFIADVPNPRLAEQPHGVVNHGAWQLGHIAMTLYGGARMLGEPDKLPAGWQELFGMGSKPVADRTTYPEKQGLIDHLNTAGDLLDQALAKASAADLEKPNPHQRLAAIFPTVGELIAGLCGPHYAYHHGQLSIWRKMLDLPKATPASSHSR